MTFPYYVELSDAMVIQAIADRLGIDLEGQEPVLTKTAFSVRIEWGIATPVQRARAEAAMSAAFARAPTDNHPG